MADAILATIVLFAGAFLTAVIVLAEAMRPVPRPLRASAGGLILGLTLFFGGIAWWASIIASWWG